MGRRKGAHAGFGRLSFFTGEILLYPSEQDLLLSSAVPPTWCCRETFTLGGVSADTGGYGCSPQSLSPLQRTAEYILSTTVLSLLKRFCELVASQFGTCQSPLHSVMPEVYHDQCHRTGCQAQVRSEWAHSLSLLTSQHSRRKQLRKENRVYISNMSLLPLVWKLFLQKWEQSMKSVFDSRHKRAKI